MKFVEEELDLVLDTIVCVLKHHTDVNDFTLEFEHVVQDEMSNDHEGLLSNVNFWVVQEHEDVLHSFVQQVGETIEEVCQSDDDVCFYSELNVGLD